MEHEKANETEARHMRKRSQSNAIADGVHLIGSLFFTKKARHAKPAPMNFKNEVFDFIKTFAVCLGAVWLLTTYVLTPVRVDGLSMYPTLHDADLGLANIFSARFLEIERFDVVVVKDKAEGSSDHWVKRVIGLPNETISCKDDVVYINGEPLEEPYLENEYANSQRASLGYFTADFDEVTLGDDEYFVMGDNRTNSTDSRYVGAFLRENITCKDVFIYYPFSNFKFVK